jgi:hypothetical protein
VVAKTGIGFRGGEISFANSSNIICRHIRVRPGSETASTEDDALSLFRAKNVMIDHSAFEFAPWNDIDAVSDDWQVAPVTDVTIQDSLIAEHQGQMNCDFGRAKIQFTARRSSPRET